MDYYLRSQIAKMANINTETLRYYEKSKLIPVPIRTERGYRLYSENVLQILGFIRGAKNAGFTLEQIRALFSVADDTGVDLNYVEELISIKIAEINEKIIELKEMQIHLAKAKANLHQPHKCPLFNSFINDTKK
jgi:DNA-binding transcriptional MerR regulator